MDAEEIALGHAGALGLNAQSREALSGPLRGRDYFVQGRRGWVRLHEKGGKEQCSPLSSQPEAVYLDSYLAAAGIAEDLAGPLFRTASGRSGHLDRPGD